MFVFIVTKLDNIVVQFLNKSEEFLSCINVTVKKFNYFNLKRNAHCFFHCKSSLFRILVDADH